MVVLLHMVNMVVGSKEVVQGAMSFWQEIAHIGCLSLPRKGICRRLGRHQSITVLVAEQVTGIHHHRGSVGENVIETFSPSGTYGVDVKIAFQSYR